MKSSVFHFPSGKCLTYVLNDVGLFVLSGGFGYWYNGSEFLPREVHKYSWFVLSLSGIARLLYGVNPEDYTLSSWGPDGKLLSPQRVNFLEPVELNGYLFYVSATGERRLCRGHLEQFEEERSVIGDFRGSLATNGRYVFSVDRSYYLHCYDSDLREGWTVSTKVGPVIDVSNGNRTAGLVHNGSNSILHFEWAPDEDGKVACVVSRCCDTGKIRWKKLLSERCEWGELGGNELFILHNEHFLVLDPDSGAVIVSGLNPYGEARPGMYLARAGQYLVFLSDEAKQNRYAILMKADDPRSTRILNFPDKLIFRRSDGIQSYEGTLLIPLMNPGFALLYSSLVAIGQDIDEVDDDFILKSYPPLSEIEVITNEAGEHEYRIRANQPDLEGILMMGARQIKWLGFMHHYGQSRTDRKQNGTIHWQIDFSTLPDEAMHEVDAMAKYLEAFMKAEKYKPGMPKRNYKIVVESV